MSDIAAKKPLILGYSVAAGLFLATFGIGFLLLAFGQFHVMMLLIVSPYVAILTIGLAKGGRWLHAVAALTWLHPIFLLASLYGTWLCGWLLLGHAPRRMFDDPKSISDWLAPPYLATWLLMISTPVGMMGGVVMTAVVVAKRKASPLLGAMLVIALGALWAVTILFLRHDPLSVLNWFFD